MWKHWTFVIAAAVGVSLAAVGNAQKTTERYIPIGRSPGLSGRYTSIGTVESVDPGANTIVIVEGSGTRIIHCNESTDFWLDRSKRRLVNQEGSLADCRSGSRVEIKYVGNDNAVAVAEWIKIEVMESE